MIQLVKSRSLCGKRNEDQKQDKETATAGRAFSPNAHATNTERCPVRLYLKFASHRPVEMKKPDVPFFPGNKP